jgi:hypothetical protein
MTTLNDVVDLYWQMKEADEHYNESWAAKGLAVGLAVEFEELMAKLRDSKKRKKRR